MKPISYFTYNYSGKKPRTQYSYPIADISDTVYFINRSEHASSFKWDFGDGFVSVLEQPFHIFRKHGQYQVSLKAYNDDGDFTEYTDQINVGFRVFREIWLEKTSHTLQSGDAQYVFAFEKVKEPEYTYFAIFPRFVDPSNLPWGGPIDFGYDFSKSVFEGIEWNWYLIENNPPTDYFDESDRFIFRSRVNPLELIASERDNHTGAVLISKGIGINGDSTTSHEIKIVFKLFIED